MTPDTSVDESLEESDLDDAQPSDGEHPQSQAARLRRWLRRTCWTWRFVSIAALAVSVALAGLVYFTRYRTDMLTSTVVRQHVVDAAAEGSVALLSYKPETLSDDLVNAKAHLTGDFLTYYSEFTDKVVAPAAKDRAVTTKAWVARAALAELHPAEAKVLVFIDQTTTSRDRPEPTQTASSVMVGMAKVGESWLIRSFDPI